MHQTVALQVGAIGYCILDSFLVYSINTGTPTALSIKPWSDDLVAPGSKPAGGENHSNCKKGSTAYSLSLLPSHCPDMTEYC